MMSRLRDHAHAVVFLVGLAVLVVVMFVYPSPNQDEPIETCVISFFFQDFESRHGLTDEQIADACGISVERANEARHLFDKEPTP